MTFTINKFFVFSLSLIYNFNLQMFVIAHISPLSKSVLNNEIKSEDFKGAFGMHFMISAMRDCDRLIALEDLYEHLEGLLDK